MPHNNLHSVKHGNGQVSSSEAVRHAAEILHESAQEVRRNRPTPDGSTHHVGVTTAEGMEHAEDDAREAIRHGAETFRDSQRLFAQQSAKYFQKTSQSLAQAAHRSFEFQQRFMRGYWDMVLEGTATMLRTSRRTADELLQPVEQQIRQRHEAGQGQETKQAA